MQKTLTQDAAVRSSMLTLTIFTAASAITPLPWFFWLGWALLTTYAVVGVIRHRGAVPPHDPRERLTSGQ